jgi:para-aminobenzoate synthetase
VAALKTLIIDNYDSFTFNLFQYIAEVNGEEPVVVLNDQADWSRLREIDFDNVVISPGPGRPERESDFGIGRRVIVESGCPLLGVCLGYQGIGYHFGGHVVHAPQPMHGRLSDVWHDGDRLFRGIPSPFRVVRYHSLAIDANRLPTVLVPTARSTDGVLMGLAHREQPIWGIQFHPESICTEHGKTLLRNFRDLSMPHRRERRPRVAVSIPLPAAAPSPLPDAETRRSRFAVRYRKLDRLYPAETVFGRLFAGKETAFWLDSSLVRDGLSRFSFMGDVSGPHGEVAAYHSKERRLRRIDANGRETVTTESIFEFLERTVRERACRCDALPFDFNGGFVGYFGYEMKQECGGSAPYTAAQPDAMFIFAGRFVAFDHSEQATYLVAVEEEGGDAGAAEAWIDGVAAQLAAGLPDLPPPRTEHQTAPVIFRLHHDRETYLANIADALREIQDGESYEICLTNRIFADVDLDHFALYRILRKNNPAPFAAFLKFPGLTVISSSPERFLRVDADRRVEAKPIKGTVRRGKTLVEDKRLAHELETDEKSRAENLMIVDLLRNDIGRVCEIGSVSVPKLMHVESYATVHQLVSTIAGRLHPDRTAIDCIKAAFPGGSMTGAPKIRTMEIIDRLERAPRGIYSGAIGFLGLNGTADLNIVIRTVVASGRHLSIGVGGAIVALSDAAGEYDEMLLKSRALLNAIALAKRGTADGVAYVIEGAEAEAAPDYRVKVVPHRRDGFGGTAYRPEPAVGEL